MYITIQINSWFYLNGYVHMIPDSGSHESDADHDPAASSSGAERSHNSSSGELERRITGELGIYL